MNKLKFNQKISNQSFAFGLFVLLPAYIFFGSIIISALMQFVFQVSGIQVSIESMDGYLNFIFDLVFVVVSLLVFRKDLIRQWKHLKRLSLMTVINHILISIPILYLANIAGSLLSIGLSGNMVTSQNQELIESLLMQMPVLMVIAVTVFAPILEELIFRLLLFTGFYKRGRLIAYVASAGLFGFLHVFQPILQGNVSEILMIFPYLFMGIGLCYVYERSNNIVVPVIAHGFMNTLSVLLIML